MIEIPFCVFAIKYRFKSDEIYYSIKYLIGAASVSSACTCFV